MIYKKKEKQSKHKKVNNYAKNYKKFQDIYIVMNFYNFNKKRSSAVAARWAHNSEVG